MAQVTHLKIRDGDTLESIAAQYLGAAERWVDIVVLNRLRAPFISKDHTDQLGPLLSTGSIGTQVEQGSVTIDLALLTPSLAVKHGSLHVHQIQTDGSLVCDTLSITGPGMPLANGLTRITLASATTFTYLVGTPWFLYPNVYTITTKVLTPGDTVILPDPNSFQQLEDEGEEFARLLGTDIEINEKTHRLTWDSKQHDFGVVKGVGNMHQAVKLRLSTVPGELIFHQAYGNRLLEFVGQRSTVLFMALAAGIIHGCIEQDVRVYAVENIKLDVTGDVCRVDFDARIKNINLLLQVRSLGLPI